MDDLIKLCDELEDCRKKRTCYVNEIVCAKSKLKCYIDGDTNKILKLKAQIKIHNSYGQGDIGILSLIVSVLTLCVTILSGIWDSRTIEYAIYCECVLVGLLIVTLILRWGNKKYGYRSKWKRYIEVALEDIDNECFDEHKRS